MSASQYYDATWLLPAKVAAGYAKTTPTMVALEIGDIRALAMANRMAARAQRTAL